MGHTFVPHGTTGLCRRTGKLSYASRKAARRAARAVHPGTPLRAYRCGTHWHYGHNPRWLVRGDSPPRRKAVTA